MNVSIHAGKPAEPLMFVNIPRLVTAYYFKWFVAGLLDGSLGFGGEESADASFLRMKGHLDHRQEGIILGLLAAEDAHILVPLMCFLQRGSWARGGGG